jgi:DNA primase
MLNAADRSDLEFVRVVCTRLGIGTYGITTQTRTGIDGRVSDLHRVHFISEDLDERMFLLDEHRRCFAGSSKSWTRRGWVVESVEPTDRVEEVFCAVVEGTHNFALEDNILTGNCFGCSAKGDVITFVREVEHLDFVEAVEKLASRVGIELTYDDASTNQDRQKRAQLVEAMEKAVDWYHRRLLTAPDAGPARGYLRGRGYDRDVVERYRLGWAPDEWSALASALRLPDEVLEGTGLGYKNRIGRQTDAFRGRVMFPIFNVQGQPVAFGGRAIGSTEGPKYKNSPETALYSKSRTLYGLNWAKNEVVNADEVIVCEGYTDVIGFALAGVPRAVATCGTALADEHFRTLKNFTRRVVLAYDADAAGQAAAERFYEWERRYEVDIAVAALPPGSDPADVARTDPDALKSAVAGAKPFLSFRVDRMLARADLRSPTGRAQAAEGVAALIMEHPNEVVRNEYLGRAAAMLDMSFEELEHVMRRGRAVVREPRAAARVADRDSPEIEALRLAIQDRDAMLPLLADVLFVDDRNLAAYRALAASESVHDAVDRADPEAATLLQRLAVEDSEADPADVAARLVEARTRDVVAELDAEARAADDAAAYAPIMGWLKLRTMELRESSSALDAIEQLVPWLTDRFEEQR